MSILWWILLAVAAYSAVMFMSSMSKSKKERFRETFADDEKTSSSSSKSVPELVDTLLRNVSSVQKTANELSKLFPATGKDKKGGFKEGFKRLDEVSEDDAESEDAGEKTKEHMLEGAPLDLGKKQKKHTKKVESEPDTESEQSEEEKPKKKEGFCGLKKKQGGNGFPYKGVQTNFTYNSSLLEDD